jgi:hypothetical protein
VVPEVNVLLAGQQTRAARAALLGTPNAAAARQASNTGYALLSSHEAATLDEEAFPEALGNASGGLPDLAAGELVDEFTGTRTAQLTLPGGGHGALESALPIAIVTPNGPEPLNLELYASNGSYQAQRPAVASTIPARAGEGATLPSLGLAITPLGSTGEPVPGQTAQISGPAALYTETGTSEDTAFTATVGGVQVDTILRAATAPDHLTYRIGLPENGQLVNDPSSGGAYVLQDGHAAAYIPPPLAEDSAGSPVPVRMSVQGQALHVTLEPGEYQYPVFVDPEVIDESVGSPWTNWVFEAHQASRFTHTLEYECCGETRHNRITVSTVLHPINEGEWEFLQYQTQGESRIFEVEAHLSFATGQENNYLQANYGF